MHAASADVRLNDYFDEGNHPNIYTVDTPVPVHIRDGELSITVKEVLI